MVKQKKGVCKGMEENSWNCKLFHVPKEMKKEEQKISWKGETITGICSPSFHSLWLYEPDFIWRKLFIPTGYH